MTRTFLWALAGLLLGGIIHLSVILSLPLFASRDVWTVVSRLGQRDEVILLPAVTPGAPNPLRLDPELSYAVCRLNLAPGPGVVSGILPEGFWSLAIFDRSGAVVYSTTNRDGIGQTLDLGIFNPAQTRLLAEQRLDVAEGLLIVETRQDDIFVVIRLAPPHPQMRSRFEAALSEIVCGNIDAGL